LEMRRCLEEVNLEASLDPGAAIQMGIGIHTGEVVVQHRVRKKDGLHRDRRRGQHGLPHAESGQDLPERRSAERATLRSVPSRLRVHAVVMPEEFQRDLGEVDVYELLGSEAAADGPALIGAAPSARQAPP